MIECHGICWGPLERETEYYPVTDALFERGTPIAGHLLYGHEFPPWDAVYAIERDDIALEIERGPQITTCRIRRIKNPLGDGLIFELTIDSKMILQEPYLLLRELQPDRREGGEWPWNLIQLTA